MNIGQIVFAGLLVIILVVVLVQFMLWLRLKYEIKTEIASWKGVITDVTNQSRNAVEAASQAERVASQACTEANSRKAETAGKFEEHRLKYEALAESFAHFNNKTIARERSEAAAQARSGKARRQNAAEPDGYETDTDIEQQSILAEALRSQSNGHKSITNFNNTGGENAGRVNARRIVPI